MDHLSRFPPGDYLAQRILARIGSIIETALSRQYVHPQEYAPWLEWTDPEKAATDEAEQDKTELRALEMIMAARDG